MAQHRLRPSSVLHDLPGARFYLTSGAAIYLSDRRTEDLVLQCAANTISEGLMFHTVTQLAIKLKKRVVHLTAEDFLEDALSFPIYCHWTRQCRPISQLTRRVEAFLIHIIERGVSLPANSRILHTSPHHDDVMLAYHEAFDFLFKYDTNFFCYVTSGFNSCPDQYIERVLRRVDLKSDHDIKHYLTPLLEENAADHVTESADSITSMNAEEAVSVEQEEEKKSDLDQLESSKLVSFDGLRGVQSVNGRSSRKMTLDKILDVFKRGYNLQRDSLIEEAETLLVLRRMRQCYGIQTVDRFIAVIRYHLNEYFPSKLVGAQDTEKVKFLKGLVRESECDRMWALNGIDPKTNVFHLRSKFYTGEYFQPLPDQKKDAQPMFGALCSILTLYILISIK